MNTRRDPASSGTISTFSELVKPLLTWFSKEARDLPWRHTRDPYAIWVSEIMLQQTQVKTVLPYWIQWMKRFPTIQVLAGAKPENVLKAWEGLGYYRRARYLHQAARQIQQEQNGNFPQDIDQIMALPGIGRYSAGAISSIAFNQPNPILDGNVIRVLTRLQGIFQPAKETATLKQLWKLAAQLVQCADQLQKTSWSPVKNTASPPSFCSHLNQSLMELGALICTPRQPNCPACPVQSRCQAFLSQTTDQLPNLGPRQASIQRRLVAFLVQKNNRFLVRQRPSNTVNADLWEFPNREIDADIQLSKISSRAHENDAPLPGSPATSPLAQLHQLAQEEMGFILSDLVQVKTVRHSITRYRIEMTAYHGHWKQGKLSHDSDLVHRWLDIAGLKKLPFTSAHRRLIQSLREDR